MAKYILREEALSHPFANGKYDHKNADINFILGHESYKEWLETLPVFTEQDIVKPYLEAIEAEAIKYSGTGEREIQAYDEGLLKAIEIIKKLLSERKAESGDKE